MNADERFDAVILGCGVSGLVSASVLAAQGVGRIALIDEFEHIGGNHIDVTQGGYSFDVGSLIFQDDSPLVEQFPSLLAAYQVVDPSWGKLNPKGRVVRYPIAVSEEVLGAGPLEALRIAASVAYSRLFHRRVTNAEEFARYWMGSRLLRVSGLEHYLHRFFGVNAKKVDVAFAIKRMVWIREQARLGFWLRRLLRRKPKTACRPNRQLVRPRSGFAELYAHARRDLEAKGATFLLGQRIETIRKVDGDFRVELEGRRIVAPRVVSTIPLDRACPIFGIQPPGEFPSVTLVSLFLSFSGERGFDQSILYNFSFDGAWKRLTMYSDFYGRNEGREYLTVEVIADLVDGCAEKAAADFRAHAQASGLFIGDLRLEGSHLLRSAYPIHTPEAARSASLAIARLKELGVQSFGRQGGFDYQPTARVSTLVAREALERRRAPAEVQRKAGRDDQPRLSVPASARRSPPSLR